MAIGQITKGSWTASWGGWTIDLRDAKGSWSIVVRRGNGDLHSWGGFASSLDAVKWACDVMRDRGVKVMILDAPSITLETLLRFNPASEAVA